MFKLDYSLESPEERKKLVEKIIADNPNLRPLELETLADYLIFCMEKQERKAGHVLTDNRLITVYRRETSFEGLAEQFEAGEDGVYDLIDDNQDKNVIFRPKISITKEDLEQIPELQQVRNAITQLQKLLEKEQSPRDSYIIRHTIIDLRKDQYIIKNAFKPPVQLMNKTHSRFTPTLPCDLGKLPDGSPCEIGVSLMNPTVISETLCHYEDLKKHCIDRPNSDLWAYMQTFDDLFETALRQEPFLYTIARTKMAGYTNQEVQETLEEEFQTSYTQQYISTLWRKKIPALIASVAEDEFLSWYYLEIEKGKYKKCSCCRQIKLALPKYFARNPSSKDGFYSLCKICRSERRRKTTSPGKTILKTTPKI